MTSEIRLSSGNRSLQNAFLNFGKNKNITNQNAGIGWTLVDPGII
jgi:hypothetical protein